MAPMANADTCLYSLLVRFRDGRTYTRKGLTWEEAMSLKTYFLERVPPAVSADMEPETCRIYQDD